MAKVIWTDVGRATDPNISDEVPTAAKVELVRGLLDAGSPLIEAGAFEMGTTDGRQLEVIARFDMQCRDSEH